jgi:hypothetical protein
MQLHRQNFKEIKGTTSSGPKTATVHENEFALYLRSFFYIRSFIPLVNSSFLLVFLYSSVFLILFPSFSHCPAGIAHSIQRWATGWMARVRFPAGRRHFSPLHNVQTGPGAHPVSYPMGTEGNFPGGKEAEA